MWASVVVTLALAALAQDNAAWRPLTEEASTVLGRTNATLTVTSVDDPDNRGSAHRRLRLKGANGAERAMPLRDGGGTSGNNRLHLFHIGGDSYRLASQRDCVIIDAVNVTLTNCQVTPPCADTGRAEPYVGAFDWARGFDPPDGNFGYGFRFLPGYETWSGEGPACTAIPRRR